LAGWWEVKMAGERGSGVKGNHGNAGASLRSNHNKLEQFSIFLCKNFLFGESR
jgi:hypothetical protein